MDLMTPATDRASNDYHYFIRGRLPEWDECLAQLNTRRIDTRNRFYHHADLAYGQFERQNLDIFPAKIETVKPPILLFIHGGYWRMMDKSQFSFIAPAFQQKGVTVALANYRLLGDVSLEAIVDDVKQATKWLAQHADSYGFDRARLVICGHSAGAHLAAHAALDNEAVSGLAGVSGVYDLEPIRNSFLNEIKFLDEEIVARLGSKSLIPNKACRALFAYGRQEGAEFARQSELQTRNWQNQEHSVEQLKLDANHATSVAQLGDTDSPLFKAVLRIICRSGEA